MQRYVFKNIENTAVCALWPHCVYCILDNSRVCRNPESSSKLFSSNPDPNILAKRKVSRHRQLLRVISPSRFFGYTPLFPSLTPSCWDSSFQYLLPYSNGVLWVSAMPPPFPAALRPPTSLSHPSLLVLSWLRARWLWAALQAWSIWALVPIPPASCPLF